MRKYQQEKRSYQQSVNFFVCALDNQAQFSPKSNIFFFLFFSSYACFYGKLVAGENDQKNQCWYTLHDTLFIEEIKSVQG